MEEKRVIYQVIPRLFGNTQGANVQGGSIEENGCGKFNNFTNNALKYIKSLGCTDVWFTGVIEHAQQTSYLKEGITEDYPEIVKGKAGSPYAIKDYYDVDPDLAVDVKNRMGEFEALIKRTKAEGLRVIIDFVPNHLARNYVSDAKPAGVEDFGASDNKEVKFAINNNFYYFPNQPFTAPLQPTSERRWQENPARVTGNDAFTPTPSINDWFETVKLNYGVDYQNGNTSYFNPIPDTWRKMHHILRYWAQKGVDGFRCDMAEMVPVQFWGWVINEIKTEFPSIIFIAEVYNPSLYRLYINEGKFDFLYDKEGFYNVLRNVIVGYQPAKDITGCWQQTEDILQKMLYFNENHDEQRLASDFFAGNSEVGKPAMLLSSALTRNPYMLYFGQELGERGMDEEGFSGRDGRTTIFDYWKMDKIARLNSNDTFDDSLLTKEEIDLKGFYKRVLNLFTTNEALSSGKFYDLMYANLHNTRFDFNKTFVFLRHTENEVLLIIVHFGNYSYDARIIIPQHALDTAGLGKKEFFKGDNLLNRSHHILFPKQMLLTTGFGVEIKPYDALIFKLK
ncbi:MAG: alpha-amylase family protein [Breznakibacter sp.]|nr:alpha-amylase family protein [Breznakibacter sp.]